jgi:lipoprotein-releasing system ATP-binding protein
MSVRSSKANQILRTEGVWKSFDHDTVNVLNGVDFHAAAGETIALCGPSGCGKSTLLHLLGGLDEPDRGRIFVNDTELDRNGGSLRLLRHEVGFVFQLHHLIPDLTLAENCLIPTVAAGMNRREAQNRLAHLAERTGLAHRLNHRIQKLSGGERQRTALCRALINQPRILLTDEPTGALDERTRSQVFQLLLDLVATEKVTLVMATHDRELAEKCQRMVVMKAGKVYES